MPNLFFSPVQYKVHATVTGYTFLTPFPVLLRREMISYPFKIVPSDPKNRNNERMDILFSLEIWMPYGEAAKTAAGFFWNSGWAFVPKDRFTLYLGGADAKSVSLPRVNPPLRSTAVGGHGTGHGGPWIGLPRPWPR